MQILVIRRVRVLGSGPHNPTQFLWEYPPRGSAVYLTVIVKLSATDKSVVCCRNARGGKGVLEIFECALSNDLSSLWPRQSGYF